MAIRNDLYVDWSVSPRIITVASPSTELSVKDLFDTLRTLEASSDAMDEPQIVDAGGYESLGGGVVVGLTVTLLNALISFEDRTGPSFTQCSISGGNLVALQADLSTYYSTPVSPTPYTQVVMANSSSATQSDLEAIQYSSFQNAVWLDTTSTYSGTDYPAGNREARVNNATSAIWIANSKGFDTLNVLGNYTFTGTENINGFSIVGQNPTKTVVTIDASVSANQLEVFECRLEGTLDGGTTARECLITNLQYVNGYIVHCILSGGTITLGGNADALIIDSHSSVAGISTPTIDFGGSGQGLVLSNYNGGIKFTNKTGVDNISVNLNAGQVILDDTVINGFIVVRGDGKLIDNNGNHILSGTWNGVTVVNETTSVLHQHTLDSIASAVWDALLSNHVVANSYGVLMKKLLTVSKFLGLK